MRWALPLLGGAILGAWIMAHVYEQSPSVPIKIYMCEVVDLESGVLMDGTQVCFYPGATVSAEELLRRVLENMRENDA